MIPLPESISVFSTAALRKYLDRPQRFAPLRILLEIIGARILLRLVVLDPNCAASQEGFLKPRVARA